MSATTELPVNTPAPEGAPPELEAPPAPPAPAPEPKPDPKPWQGAFEASQRRRAQAAEQRAATLEAEARQFREENARLRAAAPNGQPDPNDPAEIRRTALADAEKRVREEAEARSFNEACNTTAGKISKEFGQDGLAKAATGWKDAGMDLGKPEHRQILKLITELDDGHKLYHAVGSDPDLASHLLEMSPLRAAFELAKHLPKEQAKELIADATEAHETTTLSVEHPPGAVVELPATVPPPTAVATPVKPISSAPRPPASVPTSRGSASTVRDIHDPNISMDEFARQRAEQDKARRRR